MGQLAEIDYRALIRLKACKPWLTAQQYRTLRGQVRSGNPDGAMRGLHKILRRQGKGGEQNG